jgi:hypothetical protein
MTAQALIDNLTRRGIRLIAEPPRLTVEPASKLTDDDRALIRAHKVELLSHLVARVAQCDAERREAARQASRGYDFDCSAPSHAEYVERTGQLCACQTPANTIVATCRRYGVVLHIDATTGELVVGKAGAKADEPTQPWPSLLIAIEAHLEAVATQVASGWNLRAEFPERGAA